MKKNNYRSPINYLGNKSRVAEIIIKELYANAINIIEPFAGSAIISLNSKVKNIFLYEKNPWTVQLLEYFKETPSETIINNTMEIIKDYKLSSYRNIPFNFKEVNHEGYSLVNREAFNKLRDDFNIDKSIEKLLVLIIYGFNHYLRFNSKKSFNVPVGKTHYYKKMDFYINDFCQKIKQKNVSIKNLDYKNIDLTFFGKEDTVFYIDPPYLITTAPYNLDWSESEEISLYEWIGTLNDLGYKFILSNVIEANGKINVYLKKLIDDLSLNVFDINRRYLNSNYRKLKKYSREVLVKNY